MVECIEFEDGFNDRFQSLGLARLICCFSGNVRNGRRAQSVMFSLLIKLMQSTRPFTLAENSSGEGLLDGIFAILHNFNRKYLCEDASVMISPPPELEKCDTEGSDDSFVDFEIVDQDRAACLCALKVLAGLVKDEHNQKVIVSHRFFMPLCFGLLRSSKLPRPHLLLLTEIVKLCDGIVCEVGETGLFQGLVDTVISRLEQACGNSKEFDTIPANHLGSGCVDYALSDNLLSFLTTYSESIYTEEEHERKEEPKDDAVEETDCVSRLILVIGKILQHPETVRHSEPVTKICLNLAERAGRMMAANRDVIAGLADCLRDSACSENVAKCLQKLRDKHELDVFRQQRHVMVEGSDDLECPREGSTNDIKDVSKLVPDIRTNAARLRINNTIQSESNHKKKDVLNRKQDENFSLKVESARSIQHEDDGSGMEDMGSSGPTDTLKAEAEVQQNDPSDSDDDDSGGTSEGMTNNISTTGYEANVLLRNSTSRKGLLKGNKPEAVNT